MIALFEADFIWILCLALLLEYSFGDPKTAWHPVALFGRWAAYIEAKTWRNTRSSGIYAWLIVVLIPLCLLLLLLVVAAEYSALLAAIMQAVLLWVALGWQSLVGHVHMVADAESLEQARARVAAIVGRETKAMDAQDVHRAAIESLAENTSDSIIAPLFFFAVFGVWAACLYRMVNTLDAMWGYKNSRYKHFGWWSARVDDGFNLIPARLTAVLMLLQRPTSWQKKMYMQAKQHSSPNAGFPETSMAFMLGIRLGGPVQRREYVEDRAWMGEQAACIGQQHVEQGIRITHICVILLLLLLCCASLWA